MSIRVGDHDHRGQSPHPAARLSLGAIAGMGLVVFSVLACVVSIGAVLAGNLSMAAVILPLPILGLTGATLGFLALRRIGRSKGTLIGRGPAVFALFVGLPSAIIQGAFALGPMRVWWDIRNTLAPAATTFAADLASGDANAARARMSVGASSALSDERLADFSTQLTATLGTPITAQATTWLFSEIRRLGARSPGTPAAPNPRPAGPPPRPVELVGPNARVLAYFFLDDDAIRSGDVRIADALVILPGDTPLILHEAGPASAAARALGLTAGP